MNPNLKALEKEYNEIQNNPGSYEANLALGKWIQGDISKISVIMPAFEECAHILSNIKETEKTLNKFGCDYEIIIVDDGSGDDTLAVAELVAEHMENVRVYSNGQNEGKGFAIRHGTKYATGDLVVFLDADLELHPEQIKTLYEIMKQQQADVVVGSKRHPDSQLHYPLLRKILSNIYYWFVKLLFGLPVKDTQTGIKLFKREVLERTLPKMLEKRYAFDLELLAYIHHLGYKIVEAPIKLNFSRKFSRIRLSTFYRTGIDTLAIFYRLKRAKYYDREQLSINDAPKVSIIIPVKEYNGNLDECIKHCLVLDYPDYEVIVLPDKKCELPYPCTSLKGRPEVVVVPTGSVGPSEKRNIGILYATGEILAFIDDDAYPASDWLKKGIRHFGEADVAAVGGPGITPPTDNLMQRCSGLVYTSPLASGNCTFRYTSRIYREVDDYPSCNLLVRKAVMEKIGGFDINFWPGEDTIACLKITRQLNQKIIYDPETVVYHHRRPLFLAHLKQVKNYALKRGYFVRKFPQTSFRLPYFLPSLLLLGVMFGWLMSLLHPIFKFAYVGVIGLYLSSVLATGMSKRSLKLALITSAGIISTHFVYGFFFLKGFTSETLGFALRLFGREKRRESND